MQINFIITSFIAFVISGAVAAPTPGGSAMVARDEPEDASAIAGAIAGVLAGEIKGDNFGVGGALAGGLGGVVVKPAESD